MKGPFGETHKIAPPSEKNHHHQHRDNPPTIARRGEDQTEYGQEDDGGAQVGRTGRIGLPAPIGGQHLGDSVEPDFVRGGRYRSVGREGGGRFASGKVGDQHVPALGYAVAPCRGVVQVEPLCRIGLRGGLSDQFRAATNRLGGVLHGVPERCKVREEGHQTGCSQQGGTRQKILESLGNDRRDAFADPEGRHGHQEIIGDLRVVRSDL